MVIWNPWRGCHKYSSGCKYCYIHKGDARRGVETNNVTQTAQFDAPIQKYQRGKNKGQYKIKSDTLVYLCFSSDFLIEEGDGWRNECWKMIKERSDLKFLFISKRIDRFMKCIPDDWASGYDNVIVGCTVENQQMANYRLVIFDNLPIKHKFIICQPLIEKIDLIGHLNNIELVVVGGESDYRARPLNYDWVLSIREQCINRGVKFEFRQCGSNFIKDGKLYKLKKKQLFAQAKKSNINT